MWCPDRGPHDILPNPTMTVRIRSMDTIKRLVVAATLMGTGCSTYQSTKEDVSRSVGKWQRQRIILGEAADVCAPSSAQRRVEDGPSIGSKSPTRSFRKDETHASSGNNSVQAPTESPLQGYIAEALRNSPSVHAAVANVRAKLERIPQVTSLDDPVLRAIVRPEPIQTAAGDAVFTLGVGQKIPLPAKLDRKGRIAAAEAHMAIEQLNTTRLRIIADVERAYYRLYLVDRSLELSIANRKLLEALEQVVASQYRVGKVEQQDVLRMQTELSKLLNDESRYERQRDSAAAALNQLLDRPVGDPVPVTEPIGLGGNPPTSVARASRPGPHRRDGGATKVVEDPHRRDGGATKVVEDPHRRDGGATETSARTLEDIDGQVVALIELAREHNPELAALLHQTERDRESVHLAGLGYWPDLTVGFEWTKMDGREPYIPPLNAQGQRPPINRKSEQGDDNWALTFQVNLPIWSQRIEAAKREAREKLERTLQARRAASNMVAFRVYDAWVRVQTQQDTIRLFESTLIPQARQTYEVSLSSYQVGGVGFIAVIDNWRNMLNFELMLHREIAGLETAFAELQREVGLQLVRQQVADSGQVEGVQP